MTGHRKDVTRKTWAEFRATGLLWWVNRVLHLFGWAIVAEMDDGGNITSVWPARVTYRGFGPELETKGHRRLSTWIGQHASEIVAEAMESTGEDDPGVEPDRSVGQHLS